MTVFADSSALVKRYADEQGHAIVRAIDEPIVVSALARLEVPSALWRKHRLGELTSDDAALLVSVFEFDLFGDDDQAPAFLAVQVTSAVLDSAAMQVARHPLRALDAVHLATALAVRTVDSGATAFAAFDAELRAAAAREGFRLLPGRAL